MGQSSLGARHSELTPDQIRADLTYLRTQWAPLDRSFDVQQRLLFDRAVAEAMAAAETMSAADLALAVMRAAAIPRNGHTAAMVGRLLGDLPIRTWWFADGLHIVRAEPQFAYLLGARIDRLGTLAPEEALARVAPYVSGTDQRIRCLGPAYLTGPAMLRRIGAMPQAGDVALALRLRDGRDGVVRLGPANRPDPGDAHLPFVSAWSVLMPDDKALPGRWLHVLDGVADIPMAYARPRDLSTQWLGDSGRLLYIRSNSLVGREPDALDRELLFGVLERQVAPKPPQCVVLDLRFNNGGNLFETLLFAEALPKLMPQGRIAVLIGRGTFSAAIATAAMLKAAGPGTVVFIGEPMGDDGHFWAETKTKTLPNSGIVATYSTRYEDYQDGCRNLPACYWASIAFGPRGISLMPDIRVDTTFSDYAAGRDPVLDRALSLA